MRKAWYRFLSGALAVSALLFAACNDLDRAETQNASEDGFVKVFINMVAEEAPFDQQRIARTTLPSFKDVTFEYSFFKDGVSIVPKETTGGAFLLEPGGYTLTVTGMVKVSGTDTPALQGGPVVFTVSSTGITVITGSNGSSGSNTVTVPLSPSPNPSAGAKGSYDITINYPVTATATVTLDDTPLTSTTPGKITGTQSKNPGSYVLGVVITSNDGKKTAGSIEVIQISPYLTTTYSNTYTFEQLSPLIPITTVALTIPAPSQGATPVTVNNVTPTGPYTVKNVIWYGALDTSTGKFKNGVSYSVDITLKANASYTFTGLTRANAKINGNALTTLGADPDADPTLSLAFTATKEITGITIVSQTAMKKNYVYNEKLDLTGLVVKLTYSSGDSGNISSADFAEWAITTDPNEGKTLELADNNKTLKIFTSNLKEPTTVINLTVGPSSSFTIGDILDCEYNGSPVSPSFSVTDNNNNAQLTLSTDYTVTYSPNLIQAGSVKATVTGKGNYTGSKDKTFTIRPKSISAVIIDNFATVIYDGTAKMPTFTVTDGSKSLSSSTDYTAVYSNNINAGTGVGVVTLTGKGNYTGTTYAYFTISPAEPQVTHFSLGTTKFTYNGLVQETTVSYRSPYSSGPGGGFTVIYKKDNVDNEPRNAGTYTVTIEVATGGNFTQKSLDLGSLIIDKATLTAADLQPIIKEYDGYAKPVVVVEPVTMTDPPNDIKLVPPKSGLGTVTSLTYNNGSTAPTEAGVYTIRATVTEGSNYYQAYNMILGSLTINKRTPKFEDFEIVPSGFKPDPDAPPLELLYDNTAKAVTVDLKFPMKNSGTITVKYTNQTTATVSTSAPKDKGTYIVTIDVAGGTNTNFLPYTVTVGKMKIE